MAVTPNNKITVNAVDVTSTTIEYLIERPFGDAIATAKVTCAANIYNLVSPVEGQTMKIYRTFDSDPLVDPDDLIFKGYIVKINDAGPKVTFDCKDMLYDATRRLVNRVFLTSDPEAGNISEILKTIVEDYVLLSTSAASIQDSGTTNIIKKFRCDRAVAVDRMRELAQAIGWQFYYRPDTDLVYFEPKGYLSNANTLTTGVEIVKVPKWENDAQEMVNDMYVLGATQNVETTELFSGDGSTDTFVLGSMPVSIKVYVGGTLKVGGLEGITSGAEYYVDKTTKSVIFTAGNIPPAASNNISVQYTYALPIPVHIENPESKADYTTWEESIPIKDIVSIDDAITRGSGIISETASPKVNAVLRVQMIQSLNLQVGQMIGVDDQVNEYSGQYLINRYVIHYPFNYDEVYVGNKEFRLADLQTDILTRIQNLENSETQEMDSIYELKEFKHPITVSRTTLEQTIQRINDSFILGHPGDNGKLGRGAILESWEDGTTGWSGTGCTLSSQEDT